MPCSSSSSSSLLISALLFASTFVLLAVSVKAQADHPSTLFSEKSDNVLEDEHAKIYRDLQVPLPSQKIGNLNRISWKLHGNFLGILHFFDKPKPPPDVFVNLRVLWCKALSSFHKQSPAYEGRRHGGQIDFITYKMLPKYSRWPLRYFHRLFPRWMHANIELRTAYLNLAVKKELDRIIRQSDVVSICVIILGGGYDTRGVRLLLLEKKQVNRVYELDLPAVVESKRHLLERAVGRERLESLMKNHTLNLQPVDLNDGAAVDQVLEKIATDLQEQSQQRQSSPYYTLVISEALLLYLNSGVAGSILQRISERFGSKNNGDGVSFLFADRMDLKDIDEDENANPTNPTTTTIESQVSDWLLQHGGWTLTNFKSKPGATRHLGIAVA